MVDHFSIGPSGEYPAILQQMRARAETDPCIMYVDRDPIGHLFVFCTSAEEAADERKRFDASDVVSTIFCAMQMDEYGIAVWQEGDEDSQALMAEFVKWVLRTFAPCRVFDDDRNEEITDQVAQDPDLLFRD